MFEWSQWQPCSLVCGWVLEQGNRQLMFSNVTFLVQFSYFAIRNKFSNWQLQRPSQYWQLCIHHSMSDTSVSAFYSECFVSRPLILSSTKFNEMSALFLHMFMSNTSWCIFVSIICFVMKLTNLNWAPLSPSTVLKGFAGATVLSCSCLAVLSAECWWCFLVPVSVIFRMFSLCCKSRWFWCTYAVL